MKNAPAWSILLALSLSHSIASGLEPNEFFGDSTILPGGVLIVTDDLGDGPGLFPDTILGSRDEFGEIEFFDDDSSSFGDGLASALFDIPVNDTTLSFSVSGFGDDFFIGDHSEFGEFDTIVTVYDPAGSVIDVFSAIDLLLPGSTTEFSFDDPSYADGTYDVELDNTITGLGDVDFFTFTGLVPGGIYAAETFNPDGVDTILGAFDEFGSLVDLNDDKGPGELASLLTGLTASAAGELTLAVTGFDDFDFLGIHPEFGEYDLVLTLVPEPSAAALATVLLGMPTVLTRRRSG